MEHTTTADISLQRIIQKTGVLTSGLYLFALLTVMMPFYNIGINYFFMAVSLLSFAVFFLINPKEFKLFFSPSLVFLLFVYGFCFLFHFNAARISTFLYSLFYLFTFCFIIPNITHYITRDAFGRVLRLILYIFLAVMVIQQVAVVTGLPVINLNPEFSDDFLSTLSWFRINSLSSEPSYGATIIAILGMVYFYLFRSFQKEFLRFWLPAIYCFICFNSSLAIALVFTVILVYLAGRKFLLLFLIPLILYPIIMNMESENRLIVLIQELDFQNFADSFISTDLSGAFRVIPNYFYIEQADVTSINFFLGHGIDYATNYISRLMPGLEEDFNFPGGALPFMLFDYGLATFFAFSLFLGKDILAGKTTVFWLFGIFVMVNANFNTQLMWIFISLFYCCRYYLDTDAAKVIAKPETVSHHA